MKKSFIVIGLGRFGSAVAKSLTELNCDVLAMDISTDAVTEVAKFVNHSIIADATKLQTLEDLGVSTIDHAVVAIGNNLEASILTIMNLKVLGVKQITVRSDFNNYNEIFKRLGATDVIVPEEESANSLANQIISDTILDYYSVDSKYAIVKMKVGNYFEPRTLVELDLRNRFDVNIVGIIRNNEFYIPRGTDEIKPADVVVFVGTRIKINKVENFLNQK